MNLQQRTTWIKQKAFELGFAEVGIAKAEFMEPEARQLEKWLNKNYQGKMAYLENHFDKRVDPTKLVHGSKSIISLLYNYFPKEKQQDKSAPKFARYAFGEDYHFVLKRKLKTFLKFNTRKHRSGSRKVFCRLCTCDGKGLGKAFRSGVGWKKYIDHSS